MLGVYLLSLLIPSGEFQRVKKNFQGVDRLVTMPGTYRQIEKIRLGPEWLVIAPVHGFADGVLIISLVFIFGGVIAVMQRHRGHRRRHPAACRLFSPRAGN